MYFGFSLLTAFFCVGHLTAKSDVYSFGVVLLELLTGRRCIDKNRPSGQHNLVEWAKPYLNSKRRFFLVLDNRLEGQYSLDRAQKLSTLALQCLAVEPKNRPNMNDVVTALEGLQETPRSKHKELHGNVHCHTNGVPRSSRSTMEVASKFSMYPRPSASLAA